MADKVLTLLVGDRLRPLSITMLDHGLRFGGGGGAEELGAHCDALNPDGARGATIRGHVKTGIFAGLGPAR